MLFSYSLAHSHLAANACKDLQQGVRIIGVGRTVTDERCALYTLLQTVAGGAMMW